MRTEKIVTWNDNWNDVIRKVIFPDAKLKEQMLVPSGTTITQFIDKYFIQDAAPDELVTDEKVRVSYYDTEGRDSGNRNVKGKYKEFDIFVKEDHLFNATDDRLKRRSNLIAERLDYLLRKNYHVCRQHFEYSDEYDQWTKTIGYRRYHIVFSYNISV